MTNDGEKSIKAIKKNFAATFLMIALLLLLLFVSLSTVNAFEFH